MRLTRRVFLTALGMLGLAPQVQAARPRAWNENEAMPRTCSEFWRARGTPNQHSYENLRAAMRAVRREQG